MKPLPPLILAQGRKLVDVTYDPQERRCRIPDVMSLKRPVDPKHLAQVQPEKGDAR